LEVSVAVHPAKGIIYSILGNGMTARLQCSRLHGRCRIIFSSVKNPPPAMRSVV